MARHEDREQAQDMVKEFDQHFKKKFPLQDNKVSAKIAQTSHSLAISRAVTVYIPITVELVVVWKTFCGEKNKPVLLYKFQQVVYAKRETELSDKLEELYVDPLCIKDLQ